MVAHSQNTIPNPIAFLTRLWEQSRVACLIIVLARKQPDKGQNLHFISICDRTSSSVGRTGSLISFIRRHTKTLLMTAEHTEPYIRHMYRNQH